MTQMTLAFGYIRASTQEEGRQGSNEWQKAIIREYVKTKGYELEFFEDRTKSGKNTLRPDFERMLNSLDAKPKIVIVAKIDRFARSLSDQLRMLGYLDQKGIGFISVNDPGIDTTTPNGRLLLQILGAFDEFERNRINSRTKAGREKAMNREVKFGKTCTEDQEQELHRQEEGDRIEGERPICQSHCKVSGMLHHSRAQDSEGKPITDRMSVCLRTRQALSYILYITDIMSITYQKNGIFLNF